MLRLLSSTVRTNLLPMKLPNLLIKLYYRYVCIGKNVVYVGFCTIHGFRYPQWACIVFSAGQGIFYIAVIVIVSFLSECSFQFGFQADSGVIWGMTWGEGTRKVGSCVDRWVAVWVLGSDVSRGPFMTKYAVTQLFLVATGRWLQKQADPLRGNE